MTWQPWSCPDKGRAVSVRQGLTTLISVKQGPSDSLTSELPDWTGAFQEHTHSVHTAAPSVEKWLRARNVVQKLACFPLQIPPYFLHLFQSHSKKSLPLPVLHSFLSFEHWKMPVLSWRAVCPEVSWVAQLHVSAGTFPHKDLWAIWSGSAQTHVKQTKTEIKTLMVLLWYCMKISRMGSARSSHTQELACSPSN